MFAVAQTAGPYGAGLVGDLSGNIGVSLLAAAALFCWSVVLAAAVVSALPDAA